MGLTKGGRMKDEGGRRLRCARASATKSNAEGGRQQDGGAPLSRTAALERARRAETVDPTVGCHGNEKTNRMDLGICRLHDVAIPGIQYTYDEIAAWAGCTNAGIEAITKRTLMRLRAKLEESDPALCEALLAELCERREPAKWIRPRGQA